VERNSDHTEKDLLQQLYSGDPSAFTEVYNRYWDKLYYIAHKQTKSAAVAEEIVQEVFLHIWKRRASITIDNLQAYLAAMTRYEVYRYMAGQKKQPLSNEQFSGQPETVNEQDHIDQKLLLEMIEKLSHRLPEKCRMVFIQNKLLDKPLEIVAKEMDISSKTAEAHLTKALKVIRSSIRKSSSLFHNFLIFF